MYFKFGSLKLDQNKITKEYVAEYRNPAIFKWALDTTDTKTALIRTLEHFENLALGQFSTAFVKDIEDVKRQLNKKIEEI